MANRVPRSVHEVAPAEPAETGDDVGAVIAAHIAATGFHDLDERTIERTKESILDTLGVMLAAGSAPGIDAIVKIVAEQGGREEATILGYSHRVPAVMAAFANGAMGHCADYDDYHSIGLHPSTPTVPAALAMSERIGASGEQLLTAVALANDFAVRLGHSHELRWDVPGLAWYNTPLFGYFTAAAAAGKVLGLDGKRLFDGMGLAFCQAGGTIEMRHGPGSEAAGINSAWPSKCGVLCALMAERGVAGVPTLFEGHFGFYNMFFRGEYDRAVLTDELGTRFRGEEVSFKPWPTCGGTHTGIQATLELVAEHVILPEDVRAVSVTVHTRPVWKLCEPLETRQRPETIMDAKFSLPFAVAVAIVNRQVALADFTSESLENPRVLELAAKVRPVYDESADSPTAAISPTTVTIDTDRGTFSRTVERALGRWPEGLGEGGLVAKFKDCVSFSVDPLSDTQVEHVIDIVDRLEELEDVRDLTSALRGGA
jgi:2-methylcitrate dehydratase PrpD